MEDLKSKRIISRWFFLHECEQFEDGNYRVTYRIRMHSKDRMLLEGEINKQSKDSGLIKDDKYIFSNYSESKTVFENEVIIEAFANIMSEITQLMIKKFSKDINFNNFVLMERISHCLFNNMAGFCCKTEEYFLEQRLNQRLSKSFDNNFENLV